MRLPPPTQPRLTPALNLNSLQADAVCWLATVTASASADATNNFFMTNLLSHSSSTQAATHRERFVAWHANIPHGRRGSQAKLFRGGKLVRSSDLFRRETATAGGNGSIA